MYQVVLIEMDDSGKEKYTIICELASKKCAEIMAKNYIGGCKVEVIEL